MTDMHPTVQRLYDAMASIHRRPVTQAELARHLNTSSQRVKNWEARGISQQGANEVQTALGINATYILEGTGEPLIALTANPPKASQSGRQDFVRIGHAVEVLRRYLAIVGKDPKWVSNPDLIEVAFMVVNEAGEAVTPNNVIDFTERLGRKLRDGQGVDDERGAVPRAGAETG